jgi:hypothetical protein
MTSYVGDPPQPLEANNRPQPPTPNPSPQIPVSVPIQSINRPQRQTTTDTACWLIICTQVVLLLAFVLIIHVDVLGPFIDIQSATRRVSMENSTLTVERGNTEHEREVMKHDRELWEKAKEARVPHGAFWEDIWPARGCRAYGNRQYRGALRSIPEGWSETDACMNMAVEIKGVTIRRPYRCAYEWGSPHIHAYWMVDWDQPDCKPWYQDYQDAVGPN